MSFFLQLPHKTIKNKGGKKWNTEELNHSWPIMESCRAVAVSLQHLICGISTDDSFCLILFFVFFAILVFFALVLNIKQLKLELGRNEKLSLMLNFSFAHMRARHGGLFFAVHWVWSCCRSRSKHQQNVIIIFAATKETKATFEQMVHVSKLSF